MPMASLLGHVCHLIANGLRDHMYINESPSVLHSAPMQVVKTSRKSTVGIGNKVSTLTSPWEETRRKQAGDLRVDLVYFCARIFLSLFVAATPANPVLLTKKIMTVVSFGQGLSSSN